jgi:hypothetical protein
MTTEINRRITRSMTINASQQVNPKNLYIYKDDTTGIEYITKEQFQMRDLTNEFYKNNILVVGLDLYRNVPDIHPRYLNACPESVVNRKDLIAVAPEGYLWKDEDSKTSYFHFDEWKILTQHSYTRGLTHNIV